MKGRMLIVLFGAGILSGCTSLGGFSRPDTTARASREPILVTDGAVAEAQLLKPQLQLPCRIAVYLRPNNNGSWHWSPKDVAALEACGEALKSAGVATDFFLLPDMLVGAGKEDVKDLRVAAARCGAEALLVIQGSAAVHEYKNPAAIFNLTVVGGYLVPASHCDAQFVMEGVLFDTNNSYVYASAKTEGEGTVVRPTFIIESKDAVARAQAQAIEKFCPELVRRLGNLAARQ